MKNWLYIWVIGALFTSGALNGAVMAKGDRLTYGEQVSCSFTCVLVWPAALGFIWGVK